MVGTALVGVRQRAVVHTISTPELARSGQFTALLAVTDEQRDAVFRLRFEVFNLELNEGLDSALATQRDKDEFDAYCDHILIEDGNGEVVGTYRVQAGFVAARALGFYSEREFDFRPYRAMTEQMVELGRACILREHRSYEVLALLWRAVALYSGLHGARYLVGCSSVTSQDPAVGWAMYERLRSRQVSPELATSPTQTYTLPDCAERNPHVRIPKLLRAYLGLGAKICGPPALDREFKTIDFLTLLDIQNMSEAARAHFFQPTR